MTFVIGASAHGSPGVSTALQLIAAQWPKPERVPVIVEADAGGGVMAARYELSLTPGVVTLAESLRKYENPPILEHSQRLPSGVACLPLSPSASAADAQLRSAGGFLGPYLRDSNHPVFVDAGTLVPEGRLATVAAGADAVLWFVRPTREELLVLKHRVAEINHPETVAVVLVGPMPYNAEQVHEALELPVYVLPLDTRAASAVNNGGDDRYLRRSPLARGCTKLGEQLQHRIWMDAVSEPESSQDLSHLPPPPPPPAPSAYSSLTEAALNDPKSDVAPEPTINLIVEEPEIAVWTPEALPATDAELADAGVALAADGASDASDTDGDKVVVWFPEPVTTDPAPGPG